MQQPSCQSEPSLNRAVEKSRFANPIQSLGTTRYALLLLSALAQALTVIITWPTWKVRDAVPNLPVFDMPQFDWGVLVLLSVVVALLIPKQGVWIHLAVLVAATLADQMRSQPQVLANWSLMYATVSDHGRSFVRWFLVSMWFWAGLHKLLSPEWFTMIPCQLIQDAGFEADAIEWPFAIVVALSELGLGLLAWFKPRWAAIGCPMIHVGIVIFLSPLFLSWNYSVIPWNLATAVVGSWVLWQSSVRSIDSDVTAKTPRWLIAALMLILSLFYVGWFDHGYSHVLYSGNLPRGVITRLDGRPEKILTWDGLRCPFPKERRLLRQHFAAVANVGEKMHLADQRQFLDDQYFVMTDDGIQEISKSEFFRPADDGLIGIGWDSHRAAFLLADAGTKRLKRDEHAMIYAVAIPPHKYSPAIMPLLAKLPNLEQVQLSDTKVTDEDLIHLKSLLRLSGIGLYNTDITQRGFKMLEQMPSMKTIQRDE
jgi:hypothetical protein